MPTDDQNLDPEQPSADEQPWRVPSPGVTRRAHRVREGLTLHAISAAENDRALASGDAQRRARGKVALSSIANGHATTDLDEALELLKLELAERLPHLSEPEIASKAKKELDQRLKLGKEFRKQFNATAPTSTAPRRGDRDQDVELAAVLGLPLMRWWWDWMLRAPKGRPAKRSLVLGLFCRMAFHSGKPDVLNTLKAFVPSAKRDFVYGPLEGPSHHSAVYRSLESMLKRRAPQICRNLNADMWRELTSQTNQDGAPRHPDAGRYLVIDGTLIEAHAPQRGARKDPKTDARYEEHEALLRGKRTKAAFTGHKQVRGYKLMVISDLATGLPLMFKLYPANVSEHQVVDELLRRLFDLFPALPAEYLIGDAAYDVTELAYDVEFRWGLHPVFAPHETYDRELPYVSGNKKMPGDLGVPTCKHGLMKLKDHTEFWGPARRAEHGIKRGAHAPAIDARLRWVCAHGDPACGNVSTRPRTDPRVYTYLPRAGTSKKAMLRQALAVRRNSIESIFAQLKGATNGAPKFARAFWAEDQENEWLLYVALMFMTARRLVAENGDYDRTTAAADNLGLLDHHGEQIDELQRARMRREQAHIKMAAPAGWQPDDSEGGYYHGATARNLRHIASSYAAGCELAA